MAKVVDKQNEGDKNYKKMSDNYENSLAFLTACDLIFKGKEQPSGYTEPLLHTNRIKKKLKYLRDPDGNEHVIMHPFKLDWEKKIPTATVYYDEIRIGKSKDEVDINLQTKPDLLVLQKKI